MSTQAIVESSLRKPPQALEAEAAVLGAMLLDSDTVPTVMQYLKPEHFYLQGHRKVYEAIIALEGRNSPVDVVTVGTQLRHMKELDAVGGQSFLAGLLEGVLTTANCEEYAKLVLERSVQRQLITTATEIVQASYDESRRGDDLVEEAEQQIFAIREAGFRKQFVPIKALLHAEMERVEQAMIDKKFITGVATGYDRLDQMTTGLQHGDLVIVAGRPSMGKTALALNIATHAGTKLSVPVGIFSLEMSQEAITQRLLCAEAGVSMMMLRQGRLTGRQKTNLILALGPLSEAPIYIDDSPSLSALDIRARARRLKASQGLGLVVIDYLQLMEAHGDRRRDRNRQQEISEATRALKAMAKELNVPVVVISQLSRAPETRGGDKKPQLSDLRESGAIEQDADLVVMLYRGEFYNPDDASLQGLAEATIAKQRNGPLGTVNLTFRGECMKFENPYNEGPIGPPPSLEEDTEDALPE